jgi:hypothetical protein
MRPTIPGWRPDAPPAARVAFLRRQLRRNYEWRREYPLGSLSARTYRDKVRAYARQLRAMSVAAVGGERRVS